MICDITVSYVISCAQIYDFLLNKLMVDGEKIIRAEGVYLLFVQNENEAVLSRTAVQQRIEARRQTKTIPQAMRNCLRDVL